VHTDPLVILTREPQDNYALLESLKTQGIRVMEYPCIKTRQIPYQKDQPIDDLFLHDFSVLVFTSRRGVTGMKDVYDQLSTSGQYIAVVGSSTAAAVQEFIGKAPDIVAAPPTSETLAKQLVTTLKGNRHILHVRGNKSSGKFKNIIKAHGFKLSELTVYQNEIPPLQPLAPVENGIVVCASPSAVEGFLHYNNAWAEKFVYLAIGPITASYLKKRGIKQIFQASLPHQDALVKEVKNILQLDKEIKIK